jgi:hypothetical protein
MNRCKNGRTKYKGFSVKMKGRIIGGAACKSNLRTTTNRTKAIAKTIIAKETLASLTGLKK